MKARRLLSDFALRLTPMLPRATAIASVAGGDPLTTSEGGWADLPWGALGSTGRSARECPRDRCRSGDRSDITSGHASPSLSPLTPSRARVVAALRRLAVGDDAGNPNEVAQGEPA
jgi:hypothetical protein